MSSFVHEKVGKTSTTAVRYGGALPKGRVLTSSRTRRFATRQYLMMHALTCRTAVLREAGR